MKINTPISLLIALCCSLLVWSCKPKDEVVTVVSDLASGNFEKMRRAQARLIELSKLNPEAVRAAVRDQRDPYAWALAIYAAGEAHAPLFGELLGDLAETNIPLETALKYVEPQAVEGLSDEGRRTLLMLFE